jgi:hypothetical protein
MTQSNKHELDEQELLEILELAREAEQKAREMCEIITANSKKWRLKAEAKKAEIVDRKS